MAGIVDEPARYAIGTTLRLQAMDGNAFGLDRFTFDWKKVNSGSGTDKAVSRWSFSALIQREYSDDRTELQSCPEAPFWEMLANALISSATRA